jgi:hypothetical protein
MKHTLSLLSFWFGPLLEFEIVDYINLISKILYRIQNQISEKFNKIADELLISN